MIYSSKLPNDKVNVTHQNFFVQAVKLTVSLLVIVLILYGLMMGLISLIISNITPQQEKQLLEYIAFDINISNKKSTYLTGIKDKLKACSDIPYDVNIYISGEKEANAYALPGGNIHITQGMLSQIKNQNELVFIVGHELGHFKNKDHLKSMGQALILVTLATLMGDDYSFLGHTINAGGAKYSQSAEFSADKVGLELMNCAYGSVTDATKMFERMGEGKSEWEFFLATHPNFDSRVEKMHELIAEKKMDTFKKAVSLENFDE
jgi:Zn-dependent protease with chaperone function